MAKLKLYCKCGGMMAGTVPDSAVESITGIFRHTHSGDGHGTATREEAAKARRKAERDTNKLMAREARGQEE